MTTGLDSPPMSTELRSPVANRMVRPRWLNARVLIGVLLVLISVVAVARIVAGADRTVLVLVATQDLVPGQPLSTDLVESRAVRYDEGLDLYLTGEPAPGYIVARPVAAGELLPRGAISTADDSEAMRYVTLTVPAAEAPDGLTAGRAVDVWLISADESSESPESAHLLLPAATVTSTSSGSGGLSGPGRDVRVTLAVVGDDLDGVTATLLKAARDGTVYLTALPGAL